MINYSIFPRSPHRLIFSNSQKSINYDKTTAELLKTFSKYIVKILTVYIENMRVFSNYIVKILTTYFVAIFHSDVVKCQGET